MGVGTTREAREKTHSTAGGRAERGIFLVLIGGILGNGGQDVKRASIKGAGSEEGLRQPPCCSLKGLLAGTPAGWAETAASFSWWFGRTLGVSEGKE